MTFLTFVGGVVVFGSLWLLGPRPAFMVTLSILLVKCYGVNIFYSIGEPHTVWDAAASYLIIIVGCILGLYLDAKKCQHTYNTLKKIVDD